MNTYKNYKDDALTADWLKDMGLDEKTFNTAKINVVRAQAMANTLLTQHRDLLSKKQLHALTDFEKAFKSKRQRERITDAYCYCIMNINSNINRKLFSLNRKLDKR